MKAPNPIGLKRLILVVLLPLVAFVLQSMFWDAAIKPFAWFLFFPAVFFSSWIGGLVGGVIASVISTALAWWFFIPPERSFALENPFSLVSIALFMGMGFLFGYTQERVKKANRRSAEALAKLEVANRELEAFSYSVSHDLRAPLRAMDGFSRILVEEHAAELPPEAQRRLGVVRENAVKMGRLVDDLLSFSRLGRQALRKQVVDPANVVHQALAELEDEREERRIEMTIGDLPPCRSDPSLLKVVFENLLSNALKFTRKRDPARIELGAWVEDGTACYFVRDNGVGFDMRYADKLFGVFQRLHPMETFEGTGVGLATVQRIVHRHGGRVWAEAEVDVGATFYFTLEGGSDG